MSAVEDPQDKVGIVARIGVWAATHRRAVPVMSLVVLIGALGISTAAGTKFADSFSLPGTESQRADELLARDFPAQAGDAAAEVVAAPSASTLEGVAVCLLDVAPDAHAARLSGRGDDIALLPHVAFADWMRMHGAEPTHETNVLAAGGWPEMRWERLTVMGPTWGTRVIDTTSRSRTEVAAAVLVWCREALAGQAPVLRVDEG